MPTKDPALKAAKQKRYLESAAIALHEPQDRRHGTRTGYTAGCRCTGCKGADSLYRSTRRKTRQKANA